LSLVPGQQRSAYRHQKHPGQYDRQATQTPGALGLFRQPLPLLFFQSLRLGQLPPTRGFFFLFICFNSLLAGLHQRRQRGIITQISRIGAGQPALGFRQFGLVQQSSAAPAQPHPFRCLGFQPASHLFRLTPFIRPATQTGPPANQGFMRDIHHRGTALIFPAAGQQSMAG
jgi:hypothetical protein